jgi:hypothetical protein
MTVWNDKCRPGLGWDQRQLGPAECWGATHRGAKQPYYSLLVDSRARPAELVRLYAINLYNSHHI